MQAHPAKIAAKAIPTFKIVRIKLPQTALKLPVGHPFYPHLYGGEYNEYSENEGNKQSAKPVFQVKFFVSGLQGIIRTFPRQQEKQRHGIKPIKNVRLSGQHGA